MRGYGYSPYFVEGDDPTAMHQLLAGTLDAVVDEIQRIQKRRGATESPRARAGP